MWHRYMTQVPAVGKGVPIEFASTRVTANLQFKKKKAISMKHNKINCNKDRNASTHYERLSKNRERSGNLI